MSFRSIFGTEVEAVLQVILLSVCVTSGMAGLSGISLEV